MITHIALSIGVAVILGTAWCYYLASESDKEEEREEAGRGFLVEVSAGYDYLNDRHK